MANLDRARTPSADSLINLSAQQQDMVRSGLREQ